MRSHSSPCLSTAKVAHERLPSAAARRTRCCLQVEGYEFLFTEHLHALDDDIAGQKGDGPVTGEKEVSKGKDDLDQTSKEGQAVAAAFRVLLALLRYGTETTKKAVLDQIRDTDMLRSLICLADDVTNGRWYPANVGPNLLLIMQDLCRLPSTVMEEDPKMVVLYAMPSEAVA